jgi:hypothetical protein
MVFSTPVGLVTFYQFTLLVRSECVVNEVHKISRHSVLLLFGKLADLGNGLL